MEVSYEILDFINEGLACSFYLCENTFSMRQLRIIVLFLGAILLSACTDNEPLLMKYAGRAQGTTYSVSYKLDSAVDYHTQVDSILFAVDRSLSAWNPNSTLSKINRREIDSTVDPLFWSVLTTGKNISRETDGAFDMTIGPLVNLFGFGPVEKGAVDSTLVDSLLRLTGWDRVAYYKSGKIEMPEGMTIDVNAIAQGYSVDLIAEFFDANGVKDYLVEVGGEMRARGTNLDDEAWVVGIDKPSEEIQEERFQVIIGLDSAALATSGNYRKFWVDEETGVKYSHTIDPETGYPARDRILSASIIADDCMTADAMATACMVMGIDKARQFIESRDDLEAYFVYSGLTGEWEVWRSTGFELLEK